MIFFPSSPCPLVEVVSAGRCCRISRVYFPFPPILFVKHVRHGLLRVRRDAAHRPHRAGEVHAHRSALAHRVHRLLHRGDQVQHVVQLAQVLRYGTKHEGTPAACGDGVPNNHGHDGKLRDAILAATCTNTFDDLQNANSHETIHALTHKPRPLAPLPAFNALHHETRTFQHTPTSTKSHPSSASTTSAGCLATSSRTRRWWRRCLSR